MVTIYNAELKRYEVIPDNSRVIRGEEQPVFVSADEEACDAYIQRIDKQGQCQKILRVIEERGYVDRILAAKAGVFELAARICDMERSGINFKKTVVKDYDENGKYTGYHKEYAL